MWSLHLQTTFKTFYWILLEAPVSMNISLYIFSCRRQYKTHNTQHLNTLFSQAYSIKNKIQFTVSIVHVTFPCHCNLSDLFTPRKPWINNDAPHYTILTITLIISITGIFPPQILSLRIRDQVSEPHAVIKTCLSNMVACPIWGASGNNWTG
jgi:hypothetical protein